MREHKPLTDLQIDAITVQQWGWDVDFPAHRAYARAIERLLNKPSPEVCPECGASGVKTATGYVSNIETSWKYCFDCGWQGAPE
jgi:hypothetical protein